MTTPQMDWLDDQRRKRAVSSDDIVTELRRQLGLCGHSSPTYTLADCIRCGRIQAVIDEIERLRAREQDLRMHAEQDACEIERLRAEVSILMYGMEAAWGLLANGQYWDTTDKVCHSEWEHYRNKWRDDYWHPALDRDREARRG